MAYKERKRITEDGSVIEVMKYYTQKALPADMEVRKKRSGKVKQTTEQQEEINKLMLTRNLYMTMKNNFKEEDYYLTITYGKRVSKEQIEKDYQAFIKRLHRKYNEKGEVLKYIATFENINGKNPHIHILANRSEKVELKGIKSIWQEKHGFVDVALFGGSLEDCYRMAKYFKKEHIAVSGSRVRASKNLVVCRPHTTTITRSECFNRNIKAPKGYHINKTLTWQGHTAEGYPCQYIIFERDGT